MEGLVAVATGPSSSARVARSHGEAYGRGVSDLQCPARLYVGRPTSPYEVEQWAREVRPDGVVTRVDLRGGEPDLSAVADVHRGEGVLVLVDGAPSALPSLGEGQLVACEVDSDGVRLTDWRPAGKI